MKKTFWMVLAISGMLLGNFYLDAQAAPAKHRVGAKSHHRHHKAVHKHKVRHHHRAKRAR